MKVWINADDFGLTESCTKAIKQALEEKLITDTTMVANGEAFEQAVEWSKEDLFANRIGVHFNLTEGVPLTEEIKQCAMFVEDGRFHNRINRLKKPNKIEREAAYQELAAQVQKLKDAGISISHADSHHHIHTAVFLFPIVRRVCKAHHIEKIRLHRNVGVKSKIKFVVKKIYNCFLKKHGFKTTEFFGSVDDVECVGLNDQMEIMVHPDYNQAGELIDRIDTENGWPTGKPLFDIKERYGVQLISYGEL